MTASRFATSAAVFVGLLAFASPSQADTSCAEGRCSTAEARLTLEGKDSLRTSIDTGWMPSCGEGIEHCNKGIQVRANIALTPLTAGGNLFTADLVRSAAIQASWENPKYLDLGAETVGAADSTLTVTHGLTPQVEVYLDVGPVEQGVAIPATRLLQLIPGSKFEYSATASTTFPGWAFEGAAVTLPSAPLANSRLFNVELDKLHDVFGKFLHGSLSLHVQTAPTVKFRTTKIQVGDLDLLDGTRGQMPFPKGNLDFVELPATIEAMVTVEGDMSVVPAATLKNLGDMNFEPPVTITFSSVKVTKKYGGLAQKYTFKDEKIRIPLPNVHKPLDGTDGGQIEVNGEGPVPAAMANTGEAPALVRLESSDPRFIVPTGAFSLPPKSRQELPITFRPDGLGEAEATITVYSNDPDTAELTFQVKAEGVPEGAAGKKPGAGGDEGDDGPLGMDGCGCKTVPTKDRASGAAGLLAAALGTVLAARRRRR
jgi:hypothetical protein